MAVHNLDVAISDLTIGKPLDCDVLDASGIVLLRKGLVLSEELVGLWTRRGFARVLLRREEGFGSDEIGDVESDQLCRPYDPQLLRQLNQCFERAKQAIDEVIFQLAMREQADTSTLETVSQTYLRAIATDMGGVLYNAASQKVSAGGATANNALATRCIQMAVLGAVTAVRLGLSQQDCQAISMAGLLHDISLFEETLAVLQRSGPLESRREVFLRHSLYSAQLFDRCQRVSDQVRTIIAQVHEQIDGSGFPHGLPGPELSVHSRILNIVDAYLTLIEPNQSQPAYVPSDAIAYLVNHTNNGAFDRDCMKAFLTAVSIYAVGSRVQLDDSRTATILRSSRTDPLRPIVCLDDGSDTIIDLRRSKVNIARPALEPNFPHRRRLPKAQMQAILWKPLY